MTLDEARAVSDKVRRKCWHEDRCWHIIGNRVQELTDVPIQNGWRTRISTENALADDWEPVNNGGGA